METVNWLQLAIQSIGAVAVCALFIWFLVKQQKNDNESRTQFLLHLQQKDEATSEAIDKNMSYLRERDAQSKEIAFSGHEKLADNTKELSEIKGIITNMDARLRQ